MKALLALVPITVFAAASCGTGVMTVSPPDPSDSGSVATPTTGHVATCVATCTAAADCGTPGDPLYDPSHFTCAAGQCVWQGCKAASECSAEAHGGSFVCQAMDGSPVPACALACHAPADCVASGNTNPLDDASHFACTKGACEWLGCTSTADCTAGTGTNQVACVAPPGSSTKTCVPTCAKASDCASSQGGPLTDASHYACKGGTCEWLGCKSTAECTQVLMSIKYVCE
jgi:hypothetical protein